MKPATQTLQLQGLNIDPTKLTVVQELPDEAAEYEMLERGPTEYQFVQFRVIDPARGGLLNSESGAPEQFV